MYYENYLQHYGIPGQKKGIRRYQNYDGSLTEEGRRRYGIGMSIRKSAIVEAYQRRRKAKKKAAEQKEAKKREAAEKEKAEKETQKKEFEEADIEAKKKMVLESRDPALLYKYAPLFDNQELGQAYARLNTEKNIKSLIPEKKTKAKKFVDGYLKTAKTVNEVLDVSTKLVENIQKIDKLSGGFSSKGQKGNDNSGNSGKKK